MAADKADSVSRESLESLLRVQNRLVQSYFRLQEAERRLSRAARDKRPDAGRRAIQQIELERQRLGRDLHTGIGQMLAAIRLQVENIQSQTPNPPLAVAQALNRISELAGQALDQVRAVSRRLHPPEWQRLTLAEAVRQLWDMSGLPERTNARLVIAPDLRDPDLETKILVYRAFQEALANVARHSQATSVEVVLEAHPGTLTLIVRDNGVGFDPVGFGGSRTNLQGGIGLRAIREQAAALGGELTVESGPGGTTLQVNAPGPTE